MPQFDVSLFSAQIFWLTIFFIALMYYTVSVSVPRMKKLLDERWQKTEGYRIEAGRYNDDQKKTLSQVEQDLSGTREKAHDLVSKAQGEINHGFSEQKNAMVTRVKKQMADSEALIEQEKEKAVLEIKKYTKIITEEIVSKLLPLGGDGGDIKASLDEKMDLKVSNGN